MTIHRERLAEHLGAWATQHGFKSALLCTDQGLLIAVSGDDATNDDLAGLVSLFDDIVVRAERHLDVLRVDEVTLLDPGRGRLVVRPIGLSAGPRFFLVVRAPTQASWRRATTALCVDLAGVLSELAAVLS